MYSHMVDCTLQRWSSQCIPSHTQFPHCEADRSPISGEGSLSSLGIEKALVTVLTNRAQLSDGVRLQRQSHKHAVHVHVVPLGHLLSDGSIVLSGSQTATRRTAYRCSGRQLQITSHSPQSHHSQDILSFLSLSPRGGHMRPR